MTARQSITLPPPNVAWLSAQVESEEYGSKSAFITSLLLPYSCNMSHWAKSFTADISAVFLMGLEACRRCFAEWGGVR